MTDGPGEGPVRTLLHCRRIDIIARVYRNLKISKITTI